MLADWLDEWERQWYAMSAETCAAFAQIIPVLLLVNAVEWRKDLRRRRKSARLDLFTFFFEALMLILAGVVEAAVVMGVEKKGLHGLPAVTSWLAGAYVLGATMIYLLRNAFREVAPTASAKLTSWLTSRLGPPAAPR